MKNLVRVITTLAFLAFMMFATPFHAHAAEVLDSNNNPVLPWVNYEVQIQVPNEPYTSIYWDTRGSTIDYHWIDLTSNENNADSYQVLGSGSQVDEDTYYKIGQGDSELTYYGYNAWHGNGGIYMGDNGDHFKFSKVPGTEHTYTMTCNSGNIYADWGGDGSMVTNPNSGTDWTFQFNKK